MPAPLPPPKQAVLAMLARLDDDVTYERILYHVEFMKTIEERCGDDAETLDSDELLAELGLCRSPSAGTRAHATTSKTSADG